VPKESGDPKPVRMSVAEFRRSHGIMVTGGVDACPDPFQTFDDSGYLPELLKAVKEQGFTAPSSIQSQVSCSFGARGVHVCARPPAASCAECRGT
jgi:superfamily II DNA/RNA helicase